METCRLTRSYVKLGVPLAGDVFDEAGNKLLSRGFVIGDEALFEELLSRGMYVDIATFDACFRRSGEAAASSEVKRFDPFLVRRGLKSRLNRLLGGVLEGKAAPTEIESLAADVIRLADADPDAAVAASFLDREEGTYPVGHSLGTAIFCALAAARLEWDESRRQSVVCAALTMNLGMLDLQQTLQRQAKPLTPPQLERLHAHPAAACTALQGIGVVDAGWLAAVREHHERPGGGGYPARRMEPRDEAGLLRLADIIGARVAPRADRRALSPTQVIRSLFVEEGQGLAAHLVGALVKVLGLYPPGCFVQLASHEAGVVFRHGADTRSPIVAAVTAGTGTPLMQPVRRECHRKGFEITGVLAADAVNVGYDLAKLWITDARH